ncbi:MAG: helix-turn-helix domain-containing protein [Gemmataceae bacterium]|nr:helix-turn-helix domain-containing protein [Gemmataceae bacterium]
MGLLKVEQVMERMALSRETVWRMLRDGRLTGVMVGRHWRVSEQALADYLSGLPNGKAEQPVAGS